MIGFYDYTVILTYFSLLSASLGIIISLSGPGGGHPFIGVFFLLFCGLCDAFDGKVAHTKKNRTSMEKKFGIQIDSLSDLVAFGVLPCCIGVAMVRRSEFFIPYIKNLPIRIIIYAIFVLYVLAALIRLAYFNVTEEERQEKESGIRKTYTGLPVTSAALVLPFILLLQYLLSIDITIIYIFTMMLLSFLFLAKFQIKKFGLKGILGLILIGVIEFGLLIIFHK